MTSLLVMNAIKQQSPVLNQAEVARLACQIWQQEGSQAGRDQEYWFRAEQQLRAISQQDNGPGKTALTCLDAPAANAKNLDGQPAILAGTTLARQPKRPNVRSSRK